MHNFNLKMTKIVIVILVYSTIIIMISGMSFLSDSYYWRFKYFALQFDYVKTEAAFFQYNSGGILNWIAYRVNAKTTQTKSAEKNTNSIPILLYHGVINDSKWKQDDVNISLEDFRSNMFALKKEGYNTITTEDYLAFIQGKKKLPLKSFLLTFDDGRKDSYYNADPVLRTVGFTAVMNVISGRSLGEGNKKGTFHLSRVELEKMIESGRWEMESHGKEDHDYEIIRSDGTEGHFLSNKLWLSEQNRLETDQEYAKRVKDDLFGSKNDLEKKLGIKVLAFAYPFGDYGQATTNFPDSKKILASIADLLYPVKFTQTGSSEFPTNYAGQQSLLARRISISSGESSNELLTMLDGIQDKPVKFIDDFSSNKGWLAGWGLIDVENNSITIGSTETEDSALTFLGGSYLWGNYYLQANVSVKDGNAFALGGRFKDGNNYIACGYYDNRIVLSQKVNGQEKPEIESLQQTNISSGKENQVGIYLNGENVSCFFNGTMAVSGQIDKNLQHGGVSFNIWNSLQKNVQLKITKLKVSNNINDITHPSFSLK